jgi:Holliday junction resolvase
MASRGRGARAKGFQFERDVAKAFEESTGLDFQRGLGQTRGGGGEVPDVMPSANQALADALHIECKRQAVCSIKAAMDQAKTDIAKRKASSEINPMPIVVTKDDRRDTLVTMQIDDFLQLFKVWYAQFSTQPQ